MRFQLIAALVAAVFVVTPAFAQICGSREDFVELANKEFGEVLIGRGLSTQHGVVIEIFANRETGSWTFLVTMPDGTTCFVDAGEGWTDVEAGPAGFSS